MKKDHVPKRCASCRSPFWNKDYVRNISPDRLNPKSDFDKQDIPLLSHAGLSAHRGSTVRINEAWVAVHAKAQSNLAKKISASAKCAAKVGSKQAPTVH